MPACLFTNLINRYRTLFNAVRWAKCTRKRLIVQTVNMVRQIFQFITFCVDPFGIGRRFFVRPAKKIAQNIFDQVKGKADEKYDTVKDFVLRLMLVTFAVIIIIWAAVFLYAAFYYVYMPSISHTRPVHMQFKTCIETSTPCSFPHAHVPLTHKQQLLMVGQAYRVMVNIDMPESPNNLDLGMFMVCAEMRDQDSMLRGHSCRSAMMRYRSPLIRKITTYVFSPLYVLGLREEFQKVPVEVFTRYLEDRQHPITDVFVEIQSQKIQFYTVTLQIVADFSGLRYIMYNWPVFSAVVAISTNLFFIMIVFLLSWYHWSDTMSTLQDKYTRITNTIQSTATKAIESSSTFHDDEELSFFEDKSEIEDLSSGSGISTIDDPAKSQRSNEEQTARQRTAIKVEKKFF